MDGEIVVDDWMIHVRVSRSLAAVDFHMTTNLLLAQDYSVDGMVGTTDAETTVAASV